ncbi:MAG: Os1348 family NHLP clan protein [Hyalangium sp.]|uniref:Os1348 family NHLP clan protein n=1 Tax=Hyalangium sp. TaxID=2028555 RepID=UPI0038998191
MDKKIIDEIIGRGITDANFRKALTADPRKALAEAGYPVDENLLALIDASSLKALDSMVTDYESKFLGGQGGSQGTPGADGGLGGPGGPGGGPMG